MSESEEQQPVDQVLVVVGSFAGLVALLMVLAGSVKAAGLLAGGTAVWAWLHKKTISLSVESREAAEQLAEWLKEQGFDAEPGDAQ